MSVPATADTAKPLVTADDAGWASDATPAHVARATVGDWDVESSSRELPSEESLRQSLTEGEPTPSAEFEIDESGHATAEEAVAAEEKRRADAEAAGATPEPEAKSEKKSKPLNERVATMRQRLDQTRFELGQEERRLAALRKDIAEMEAKRTAPVAEGATPAPTEKPTWKAYDEAGKDFDEFSTDLEAYLGAQVDVKFEAAKRKELADAEAARAARQHQEFSAALATRIDAGREAHEDFDEAIEALSAIRSEDAPFLHDAIATHDQGGEIMYFLAKHLDTVAKPLLEQPLTYPMMDALRETTRPTDLLAYFAANPDQTERIARLEPASALVALGRIVAQVEGAPAGSPAPPLPVTRAVPPPAARVDGSRRVAGPRSGPDPGEPPGGWDQD